MAVGLLIFYVFCLQCAATIAVIRRETNSLALAGLCVGLHDGPRLPGRPAGLSARQLTGNAPCQAFRNSSRWGSSRWSPGRLIWRRWRKSRGPGKASACGDCASSGPPPKEATVHFYRRDPDHAAGADDDAGRKFPESSDSMPRLHLSPNRTCCKPPDPARQFAAAVLNPREPG